MREVGRSTDQPNKGKENQPPDASEKMRQEVNETRQQQGNVQAKTPDTAQKHLPDLKLVEQRDVTNDKAKANERQSIQDQIKERRNQGSQKGKEQEKSRER